MISYGRQHTSAISSCATVFSVGSEGTGSIYFESSVDRGNITAISPASYTYNPENMMTAVGGSVSYVYDAQNRRTKKTVSGTTTDYFYSGSELIAEKTGSTWTDYIFFGDARIAQNTGATHSTAVYLHSDHLGSTRVCTDANGNSTGTCDYEPFGEYQPPSQSSCSALPTNFKFAGMQLDIETGLYHTWFRQYDVNQGRWMTLDPVRGLSNDPQTFNAYPYVWGDPANLIDPTGQWPSMTCTLDGIDTPCGLLMLRYNVKEFDLMRAALSATNGGQVRYPCGQVEDCVVWVKWDMPNKGALSLLDGPPCAVDEKCASECKSKAIVEGGFSLIPSFGAFFMVADAVRGEGEFGKTDALVGFSDLNRKYQKSVFEAATSHISWDRLKELATRFKPNPRFAKAYAVAKGARKVAGISSGVFYVFNAVDIVAEVEACAQKCTKCDLARIPAVMRAR